MNASDFVSFCENLSHYLSEDLHEDEARSPYPMGKLDGLTLHFVHYPDFATAKAKWNERRERVGLTNVFCIMTDRDDFSEDLLPRIDALSIPKVLFSSKRLNYPWVCYVPGHDSEGQVGDLTELADYRGNKQFDRWFDFVRWLNGHEVADCLRFSTRE